LTWNWYIVANKFSHAHSVALFIHSSITVGQKGRKSSFQVVSPSRDTLERLLIIHSWPKKCEQKTLKQLVAILMLNTIRIFHGLGKFLQQADLMKLFESEFGVSYWLKRLQEEDEELERTMRDNYFKTLYKVVPTLVHSRSHFLGISFYAIQCYTVSKSLDIVTLDKLIAQLYGIFAKSHDLNQVDSSRPLLRWFSQIAKMQVITSFKRSNCILWLDGAWALAEKLHDKESLVDFCNMALQMMESEERNVLGVVIRNSLLLEFGLISRIPMEKFGVLDSNIVFFLFSRLSKYLVRHIQPVFHEKLSRKPHATLPKAEMYFEYMHKCTDRIQGISHEKTQGLRWNLLLAEGMASFINGRLSQETPSPFFKALEIAFLLNSSSMCEQISTHLFNLGSFLNRERCESDALLYLQKSYETARLFESEIASFHRKVMAYVKSLMMIPCYEDVCKVVKETFTRFCAHTEYWKPLVILYVQASCKLVQSYVPLNILENGVNEANILNEELTQLELINTTYSRNVQMQLLENVVGQAAWDQDTMHYAVKLCTLKREMSIYDSSLSDHIHLFKPETSLHHVFLGRLHFESGMNCKNETEASTFFQNGFTHFETAVKSLKIYRTGSKSIDWDEQPIGKDHLEFLSIFG
jgi:hypothetical protein